MNDKMKKIFYILFFMIIVVKVFPDENIKRTKHNILDPETVNGRTNIFLYGGAGLGFCIEPELATLELITFCTKDTDTLYWKLNILNMHFIIPGFYNYDRIDFEVTPAIITKDLNFPPYDFSIANIRASYVFYFDYTFIIKPFLEINYLFKNDDVFDTSRLDLKTGIRIGTINICSSVSLFYVETGYAYRNNTHNYYFSIGTSPLWIVNFFKQVALF
jgi:hypothetical protein